MKIVLCSVDKCGIRGGNACACSLAPSCVPQGVQPGDAQACGSLQCPAQQFSNPKRDQCGEGELQINGYTIYLSQQTKT